jgi:hypothetical protein
MSRSSRLLLSLLSCFVGLTPLCAQINPNFPARCPEWSSHRFLPFLVLVRSGFGGGGAHRPHPRPHVRMGLYIARDCYTCRRTCSMITVTCELPHSSQNRA